MLDPLGFDGWGNDLANWIDSKLDYADSYWQYAGNEPAANAINETVIGGSTDVARDFSDLLRVGKGVGDAIFTEDENGYGRAALVLQDVVRAAAIINLLGGAVQFCPPAGLPRSSSATAAASKRFTPDQDALVQLSKEARRTGVNKRDAKTLRKWADEYDLPSRGPESHPGRKFGSKPHIHVDPVNHIPVRK